MIHRSRSVLIRSLGRALEERAAELLHSVTSDLEALSSSDEEHHLANMDDLGGDALDQEATLATMQLESDQLEQIQWALQRLDDGSYGLCEDCGAEIPEDRLVALPLATRCLRCQVAAETGVHVEEQAEEPEEEVEPPSDERFARPEDPEQAEASDEDEAHAYGG